MKLTRKFTVGLTLGVLVIQVGFALLRLARERAQFREDIVENALVLAQSLAQSAEVVARSNGEAAARALVVEADDRDAHVRVRWVSLGALEFDREPFASAPDIRGQLEALRDKSVAEPVTMEVEGEEPAVYVYAPVTLPDGSRAAVEIADPWRDEDDYMQQSAINAVLSTTLLVMLCSGVAWIVGAVFIGRPVRALVRQARQVATGDLSGRVELRQRDELRELATETNAMCQALQTAREAIEQETQQKIAAMEQLKHADRLRTVGTLASGVAHELGTPLNVVSGHAQLIVDAAATSETTQHATVIARQARRMTGIIRQLLDFARREQADGGIAPVFDVAKSALAMAAPLAKKRGVELVAKFADPMHGSTPDPAEPTHALSAGLSSEELTQVLVNIVVNGVQATPKGGTLTVDVHTEAAAPPFSQEPKRAMVHITISDTGRGMDPATLERVFEPFFTTKQVGEGTGLGLSVAYGIVKERGGWIDVASEPDHGSRFSVFLPEAA